MKYRGYHRHARTIITGCPHLAGYAARNFRFRGPPPRSFSLALSSLSFSFTHTHIHTPYRDLRISSLLLESHIVEREESASSNEAKFITGVCRATIALIRLNSNRISRFRARPFHRRWKERRRGCNRSRGCCGNECRSRRREFGEWSGN